MREPGSRPRHSLHISRCINHAIAQAAIPSILHTQISASLSLDYNECDTIEGTIRLERWSARVNGATSES